MVHERFDEFIIGGANHRGLLWKTAMLCFLETTAPTIFISGIFQKRIRFKLIAKAGKNNPSAQCGHRNPQFNLEPPCREPLHSYFFFEAFLAMGFLAAGFLDVFIYEPFILLFLP
jgi:hypothetical protein